MCLGLSNILFLADPLIHVPATQTIGAEFNVKQVTIPETNVIVELFIYDCAGQSIFNQLDLNSKYVSKLHSFTHSSRSTNLCFCRFTCIV